MLKIDEGDQLVRSFPEQDRETYARRAERPLPGNSNGLLPGIDQRHVRHRPGHSPKRVHADVSFGIARGSRQVQIMAVRDGLVNTFLSAGARLSERRVTIS